MCVMLLNYTAKLWNIKIIKNLLSFLTCESYYCLVQKDDSSGYVGENG